MKMKNRTSQNRLDKNPTSCSLLFFFLKLFFFFSLFALFFLFFFFQSLIFLFYFSVFQSQLYALEEFERAFVSERAALGLAPVSNNSNNANGDSSASSSRSHRRRHRGGQSPVSSSPPRRRRSSPQSVLLTTAGVPLLDALLENIVVMKSGRWDCIELISAPAFGEVVRVEDQGILLIAPTRTHIHIPNQSSDAKLCVLNHLLETLQYPHTAEFDESKTTIVLVNSDNGVRADLRTPVIVPTPLYLRSERATRGIIIAMPGEIVVSPSGRLSPKSTAAANGTTAAAAAAVVTESPSEPAAPAVATGDNAAAIAKRKNKMSRVQWRLSRNMAMEFRPDQEH
jgi:hypothetical protein